MNLIGPANSTGVPAWESSKVGRDTWQARHYQAVTRLESLDPLAEQHRLAAPKTLSALETKPKVATARFGRARCKTGMAITRPTCRMVVLSLSPQA